MRGRHRTAAGGNVFEDLGFPKRQAREMLRQADARIARERELKQQAAAALADWIRREGLTQLDAAALLSVSRPRVSDLVNFKLARFSLDTLTSMLLRIGKRVELVVR